MLPNESFVNTSQNLFAPEMIRRISEVTGQSINKTREALTSIIPSFTSDVIEQGATLDRSAHLLELVSNETEISEIAKSITNRDVTLGASTGLTRTSVHKIINFIAPFYVDIIKAKVKSEKLGASGLMEFLQDQRIAASGLSKETSEYYKLSGQDPLEDLKAQRVTKFVPWTILALILFSFILILMWFWWNGVLIESAANQPIN